MCNCCVGKIKTTKVEVGTGNVVYTIPANTTLNANQAYNIIFCQPLPDASTLGSSIIITNGTNNYNVFTRKGDTLLVKNIINNCGLKTWFSSGNSFVLRNFICRK